MKISRRRFPAVDHRQQRLQARKVCRRSADPTLRRSPRRLSNNTPLVFGMGAEEASAALGVPLNYVSGRPGDEIFLAFRNVGGNELFFKKDRLYLQFRKGRLAGWKGDWGHNWMWQ